ncbi:MAG: UDP-N-acetylmuramate--L-alanine ligase, partial [Candidatus Omnitrophica bacterium]|nr:UDP-N-acetylmuramate--L-alanine ligase [Candidatus Omnitrophota bacterium]
MIKQDKIHFVGIGGAGMSALALLLLQAGKRVSGSDLQMNSYAQRVKKAGGKIFLKHCASNLKDAQMLIFSSAISSDNTEIESAKQRNIPIKHRGELLADLAKGRTSVAISGMHGKTSVANMLAVALINAQVDPTVVLGGESFDLKGNACLGKSSYFVAEADESDGSFLRLSPTYAVITNIEAEHIDFYKSEERILSIFKEFCQKVNKAIFYNGEDKNIRKILCGLKIAQKISFGFSPECDIFAKNIIRKDLTISFDCFFKQ